MSRWVRLWDDMPTDPKWRVVSRRAGRPLSEVIAVFVFMLTAADASTGALDGFDDEDVGAALDIDPEAVAAIRNAMEGKVIGNGRLSGWDKRQPKRQDDQSTDRVRAFRERQRAAETQRGDHETQRNADETQCNAPEEIREEEKRKKDKGSPAAELELVVSPETASAIVEHRQRMKAPLTARAAKALGNKLKAWPNPEEAAAAMLSRGWRGFEPDWMPKQPERKASVFPMPAWKPGRLA